MKKIRLWHIALVWLVIGAIRYSLCRGDIFVFVSWGIPMAITLFCMVAITYCSERVFKNRKIAFGITLLLTGLFFSSLSVASTHHEISGDMDFRKDLLAYPFIILTPIFDYSKADNFLVRLLYDRNQQIVLPMLVYLILSGVYSVLAFSLAPTRSPTVATSKKIAQSKE